MHDAVFLFEFDDILDQLVVLFFYDIILFLKLFQVCVNVNGFKGIELVAFLFVFSFEVLVLVFYSSDEVCVFVCPEILVLELDVKGPVCS